MLRPACLVCVLVSTTVPASAQDGPDALLERGIELREAGRDAEALEQFERAYEQHGQARAMAQIALAEQALGRWVEAEEHLRRALSVRDDAWIEARREVLERELAQISAHLGSLEIVDAVEGASVFVNGRDVGQWPRGRMRVQAGEISVELRLEGYEIARRRLTIASGAFVRESIPMIPLPAPAELDAPAEQPAPPSAEVAHPPAERTPPSGGGADALLALAVSGLGVAAVALGVGVGLSVFRDEEARTFNSDECVSATMSRRELCGDQLAAVHSAEAGAAITYVAGGLLTVGAIVLLLSATGGGAESTALRCVPTGLGAACGGAF